MLEENSRTRVPWVRERLVDPDDRVRIHQGDVTGYLTLSLLQKLFVRSPTLLACGLIPHSNNQNRHREKHVAVAQPLCTAVLK